jgi:hypothetical protein
MSSVHGNRCAETSASWLICSRRTAKGADDHREALWVGLAQVVGEAPGLMVGELDPALRHPVTGERLADRLKRPPPLERIRRVAAP